MKTYSEKDLMKLSEEYDNIPIPDELESMMLKTFRESKKANHTAANLYKTFGSAAAAFLIFTVTLNVSPPFARAAERAPVIGGLARLVSFRAYEDVSDSHAVQINSAVVSGLNNVRLVSSLNQKYAAQSKLLYEEFMAKVNAGGSNIALFTGYTVKARTDTTISIENSLFESAGSSNTQLTYDTVDTKNGLYLKLPMMFTDDRYIGIISDEIKARIQKRMADDPNLAYFTGDDGFKSIDANQTFYINDDHKLVIVFDKYAIAPGYMGNPSFVIDTPLLKDVLSGGDYLR